MGVHFFVLPQVQGQKIESALLVNPKLLSPKPCRCDGHAGTAAGLCKLGQPEDLGAKPGLPDADGALQETHQPVTRVPAEAQARQKVCSGLIGHPSTSRY